MRARLTRAFLRASGLPSLGPVVPGPGERASFDEVLAVAEPTTDISLLTLLRWIAQERGVLFHGSQRDDLLALEPIRLTRDSTPFGDQQAVFVASDPVWSIYFAALRRGNGFRSTRNGSLGVPGDALYPRWHYFSHNEGAERAGRFGDGWLYVLPRETMFTTMLRASRPGRRRGT